MKKDAYFFPHFSNARHDRKLKRVIKELGVEGYGIYFMLLEVLREQIDFKYPLGDIDLLADEFNTSEQKVRTVISNYHLFDVNEDDKFFSMKLVFYMQPYIEQSERARLAARKRWDTTKQLMQPNNDANAYANALLVDCDGTPNAMQGEENKGEENKVKEYKRFTPPTLEEVTNYCDSRNNGVDSQRFIDYNESRGWMVGKGKMKDWKAAVRTWEKNEKAKSTNNTTIADF